MQSLATLRKAAMDKTSKHPVTLDRAEQIYIHLKSVARFTSITDLGFDISLFFLSGNPDDDSIRKDSRSNDTRSIVKPEPGYGLF